MHLPWREAMERALYGPSGFFVSGAGPAAHFRTSVHASPVFASALLRLIDQLDSALGFPARFDVVDVGAGRGELLRALSAGVSGGPSRQVAVRVSGEPRSAQVAVGVSGEPDCSGRSGLIPPRSGFPETLTTAAAVDSASLTPASGSAGPSPDAVVPLAKRIRFTAVELAPRPDDLPEHITWVHEIPANLTGLLLATEWLDNVPLDIATYTDDGWRYLLVDPTSGVETTGDQVSPEDAEWLDTWWPLPVDGGPDALPPEQRVIAADPTVTDGRRSTGSGFRAARPAEGSSLTARSRPGCPETSTDLTLRVEIGRTRDEAWAAAVSHVDRGLALAVDYGHLRGNRPFGGSLTGYRSGRQVPPAPDGSCDVTAHVAMDSVASAGERVARCAYLLESQRAGLGALGADGGRPPLALAVRDPAGYVRALAEASAAAELTDPTGLGGHWWLWQPVGLPDDRPLPGRSAPADFRQR
ncbi:SAM-dependent methyltransferase [Micromonospora qiuiae]|uniref:SAM-dependent methyltransferase n=1 Tax=Micromonospora qiuiae TaxID=502268 RepID=UPI00355923C3